MRLHYTPEGSRPSAPTPFMHAGTLHLLCRKQPDDFFAKDERDTLVILAQRDGMQFEEYPTQEFARHRAASPLSAASFIFFIRATARSVTPHRTACAAHGAMPAHPSGPIPRCITPAWAGSICCFGKMSRVSGTCFRVRLRRATTGVVGCIAHCVSDDLYAFSVEPPLCTPGDLITCRHCPPLYAPQDANCCFECPDYFHWGDQGVFLK